MKMDAIKARERGKLAKQGSSKLPHSKISGPGAAPSSIVSLDQREPVEAMVAPPTTERP